MAYTKFDFTVPQLNNYFVQKGGIDYSKSHIIESHKKMIENVDKNYGKIIDKWADVFQIDRGILICFICTESGGKNAPRNRFDATGLMQVTTNTVYEVITKWNSQVKVPLSNETKNFLNRKVSTTSKWSSNRLPTSAEKSQISSKLMDVEYNIAVGTATIRWMIEAFAKIGVGGLDKVMVAYNAGYYGMRNRVKNLTAKQIVSNSSIPKESRAYVLKMLGVNGFMDLYYNVLNK
jgi:soluble lytic murein transglycosylase-like protein